MFFFVVCIGIIYTIQYIDNILKNRNVDREWYDANYKSKMSEDELETLKLDHEKGIDSFFVLVPLLVVLTLIVTWFFYLRFVVSFIKRKKLIWVEVMDCLMPQY